MTTDADPPQAKLHLDELTQHDQGSTLESVQ